MEASKYYPLTEPTCYHSDLTTPDHRLCRRYDSTLSVCSACKGGHLKGSWYYYYCATCNLEFHRGCHRFPPELIHPFHPSHPLTFVCLYPDFDMSHLDHAWIDKSLQPGRPWSDGEDYASISDKIGGKCKCCWRPLIGLYYHCFKCNFSIDIYCTLHPPQMTITHLKSHEHTLTVFHTRIPLPSNACGVSLDKSNDIVYACLPCSYMVHKKCIYLPRVIKLTRHPHRLSFTSVLSSNDFPCGVCRQSVNVNYGQYSCNEGCPNAVHSKCATRDDVWDGKELEGVPEEYADITEPFTRIDEATIQHFSHDHHLSLHCNNNNRGKQENKFCHACIIPIMISESFYVCNLLECVKSKSLLCLKCATIPSVAYYKYDRHPLTLCCGEEDATNLRYWCEICESQIDATKWFYTCNHCQVTLHLRCLLGDTVYFKPRHRIKISGEEDEYEVVLNSGNSRPFCCRCSRRCIERGSNPCPNFQGVSIHSPTIINHPIRTPTLSRLAITNIDHHPVSQLRESVNGAESSCHVSCPVGTGYQNDVVFL
ncbi:unnamed protein product [Microthlaspi erraticum]|uniref:Phorbol-ester/DAG-type domain-containing protein n=1 Tax=Microthlaspi erraticum TaxID=1685480 RepID=A0A6D2KIW3_9BRAS|nr:unnamed protein product [Microthlaspi erraticum]